MENNRINKYVGARYIPLVVGEWDNTRTYEPLMIVSHSGASYTSKSFVPVGVDINNSDYWLCSGNYNAQVELYRQEVVQVKNEIDGKLNDVERNVEQTLSELVNNTADHEEILTALEQNIDFLRNKSILIIGDSMSDESTQAPNWVTRFKELTASVGTLIVNKAVNGASLSGGGMATQLSTFLTEKNNYDYIIFHIGTNDCTGQRLIGSWSDTTTNTFMGALNIVNNTLVGMDNRSKIFWVIPPHTYFGLETFPRPIHLNVYRCAIVKACQRFKWSIIDAYTHAPFLNPYNQTSMSRWISDGLHPNSAYAPYFVEFVVNQLRSGGVNTIGDIPTTSSFPIAISGESGNLSIIYHTDGTFDIDIAINLSAEWGGGYLVKNLPAVLFQAHSFICLNNGVLCKLAFLSDGLWIAPLDTTVKMKSLIFRMQGLRYASMNPPYAFSY